MTNEERRSRTLASHAKYNASTKGRARYARYEAKHPERKENRWEPARNGLRKAEGNDLPDRHYHPGDVRYAGRIRGGLPARARLPGGAPEPCAPEARLLESCPVVPRKKRKAMNDLTQATIDLVSEFRKANTKDSFYLMTDGGDGLTYAEKMADLLARWVGQEHPSVLPIKPLCPVCHQKHVPFRIRDVDGELVSGHEYIVITRTSMQKYPREWRMGFLGAHGASLQFSARGPDRSHKAQYGGTQTFWPNVIQNFREVERDDAKRHVGEILYPEKRKS